MTIERTNPVDVYAPPVNAYAQVVGTNTDRTVSVAGTVPENEASGLVGVGGATSLPGTPRKRLTVRPRKW